MFIVDTILESLNKAVDKIFPDANIREQVKAQIATQALEWYKLELSDRDSARRREVDSADSTTSLMAWLYTIGYFVAFGCVLFGWVNIDPAHDNLMDVLMGVLTAGQYSIMAYYFGSSHGSAKKDGVINRVVNHRD